MEVYWLDWASMLLRWLHVVAVIAWAGASFYFVFLDKNLLPPTDPALLNKGVDGAMWAVHGGGFYHPQKYLVAPKTIDSKLHWFYWESYTTWLSGFALFVLLYLYNADIFLIDKDIFDWSPASAIAVALSFGVVFWFAYDAICRIWGFGKRGDWVVYGLVFAVIALASFLATRWFSGRAAFLLIGAMMGTAMSANVFFWIIPGQKKTLAQMQAGEVVNPVYGQRGKQRSVHNTYFTLPVLFTMLSNHYNFLYSGKNNWLVLVLMVLLGALIRQFFVQRYDWHNGRARNPWPYAAAGVALILGLMFGLLPGGPGDGKESATDASAVITNPSYAAVQKVLAQRCYSCHGPQLQMKNLRLDIPSQLQANAALVYQSAVLSRAMPLSNATGMTGAERRLIARWFKVGAPVQ